MCGGEGGGGCGRSANHQISCQQAGEEEEEEEEVQEHDRRESQTSRKFRNHASVGFSLFFLSIFFFVFLKRKKK